MKRNDLETAERAERLARTGHLLRQAAEWEPDTLPPADLAHRALGLHRGTARSARRAPQSPLWGLLFAGAAGVGACCAAVALALTPAALTPDGLAGSPSTGLTKARSAQPFTGSPQPVLVSAHGEAEAETDARPVPRRHRSRGYGHSAPAVLAAHWKDETVSQEVAGVVSPGWLLRPDSETGEVVATPGVLEIPLTENACGPVGSVSPMPEADSAPKTDPEPPPNPEAKPEAEPKKITIPETQPENPQP